MSRADVAHVVTQLRALTAQDRASVWSQLEGEVSLAARSVLYEATWADSIELHPSSGGAAPENNEAVEIIVRDNGPGISAEVLPNIFDPFFSGREAGRGIGFGLSKCWRIVTQHGGQIDVESEPGRGATFKITLPTG